MKFFLSHGSRVRVFFDADNLESLDTLFDAVRSSRRFVCILSAETASRAWCLGELAVAHLNEVPIVPVVLPGEQTLLWSTRNESGELAEVSDDTLAVLAPYQICRADVEAAISHVVHSLDKEYSQDAADAAERVVSRISRSSSGRLGRGPRPLPKALLADLRKFHPQNLASIGSSTVAKVVVAGDGGSLEAVSAVIYLTLSLQRESQQPVVAAAVDGLALSADSLALLRPSVSLIVVLTPDLFRWPALAAYLVLAVRRNVFVQPVLSTKEFKFPSQDFWKALEESGEPLGRSPDEAAEAVNACWRAAAPAGVKFEEPITVEEVSRAWRQVFKRIACPCDINHSSESAINEQVLSLMNRLKAGRRTAASPSTPAGEGFKSAAEGVASLALSHWHHCRVNLSSVASLGASRSHGSRDTIASRSGSRRRRRAEHHEQPAVSSVVSDAESVHGGSVHGGGSATESEGEVEEEQASRRLSRRKTGSPSPGPRKQGQVRIRIPSSGLVRASSNELVRGSSKELVRELRVEVGRGEDEPLTVDNADVEAGLTEVDGERSQVRRAPG